MKVIPVDKQVERVIEKLNALPEDTQRATVLALNRTAVFVKNRLSQEVSKKARTKLKTIRNKIKVQYANRRSLSAMLTCDFQSVLVIDCPGVKQTAAGVIAGGFLYPHAFIATLRSGGAPGVYRRVGKKRIPVKRVTIPIFGEAVKEIEALLGKEGRRFFEKRFLHEIRRTKKVYDAMKRQQ